MLIKFIFLIVFIQLVVTHVVYNKKTITVKPVKSLIINRPLKGSAKMYANKPLYRIPSFTCNRMNCQMFCFDSNINFEYSGECRCKNIKRKNQCNMTACQVYCSSCNIEYSISFCFRTFCKCLF